MSWRQFLETTRAYLANEEPRDMTQPQPNQFPFTNSTDCTRAFGNAWQNEVLPPRHPTVDPRNQPPAGKLLCPCCQRSLTCLFCEAKEFVASAPGPGVES